MRLYVQRTYYGMAQWVLCARLHPAEERLARWLLMCHDRVGADSFPIRHAGLLEADRGAITITDLPVPEAASFECWRVTTVEYRRRLGRGPECRPEPARGGVC